MARPTRRQTSRELADLQRLAARVIMQPLDARLESAVSPAVADTFIKCNDRLTSAERIGIYNRQYWYRLIDCLYDDYPGLLAILGRARFNQLITAYLQQYPSRSFALRNLGDRLTRFITEQPLLTGAKTMLAAEMAAFEWAQVVAFDGEEKPPLTTDDLLQADPATLTLAVQPCITLLDLHWPLDDFSLAIKRRQQAFRSEASNAVDAPASTRRKAVPPLRKRRTCVVVHRLDFDLYYKRLPPQAFALLAALRDGATLASACESSAITSVGNLQKWFAEWAQMGWFCRR